MTVIKCELKILGSYIVKERDCADLASTQYSIHCTFFEFTVKHTFLSNKIPAPTKHTVTKNYICMYNNKANYDFE